MERPARAGGLRILVPHKRHGVLETGKGSGKPVKIPRGWLNAEPPVAVDATQVEMGHIDWRG